MAALGSFLGSSSAHLLLCMGVAAMMGVLHLWMSRRVGDESWWIAVWAGISCVFAGARGVQLTTSDPAAALMAAKVAITVAPYLLWALVGFGRNLNGHVLERRTSLWLGGVAVAWTVAVLATPWFVSPEVTTRSDVFGREHFSVHALWPMTALSIYIGGAFVWGVWRLRTSGELEPRERAVLLVGFGIYALLGVGAVLTAADVIKVPAMAEYGPLAVAMSLSYLLVQRRRRVERQLGTLLAASEGRYRELVHHAPVGVFSCDAQGDVTMMNPRMSEMLAELQVSPEQSIWDDTAAVAAADIGCTLDAARARHEVVRAEHRISAAPDGLDRVWHVTASPLEGDDTGVLVVADDITERSQLEKQLQQAQKMDSIGQLAAGIAHEINNPMAFVRANLSVMKESAERLGKDVGPDDPHYEALAELETLVDESMEGVERTIAIVRDVRELAYAGDEGAIASDLAPILDACVRVASVVDKRDVAIHAEIPRDLRVAGAAGPLRQVFLNLVINALQAVGDSGQVWVESRRDTSTARITVHDNGPGIPPAARSRLFDPFFTTKRVGEGTGLGLYISYQIVRNCGGDIRVSEGPEGGASFEVSLPLAEEV